MPRLTILPLGKKVTVPPGTTLLNAIQQAGIQILSPCDGQRLCGKCKVQITAAAAPGDASREHLTREALAGGFRLACEVVVEKDLQLTLPEDHSLDTRILEGERIKGSKVAAAAVLEQRDGRYRLSYEKGPKVALTGWQSGFAPKGVAVDLGTTTLVVTLMDLVTGAELATVSALNPQTRHGHDVMTRIYKAKTQEGLDEMAALVRDALNTLVAKACQEGGATPQEIVDAVVGGNTTMLQIAAAIDPVPLGRLPFMVGIEGGRSHGADRFGLEINQQARVYLPPVAHAFVGSDISAGLLSVDFFHYRSPTLFIDLGTNGELALIANGHLTVTSTAAGPAFEGMGISHGMRAAPGAIESVTADDRFLHIGTIDDAPARGICGSGIMDIMACLIDLGAVDAGGRLINPTGENIAANPFSKRYETNDGLTSIRLTDTVRFTQKDIRQFQLAKSAIQTGVEMLLSSSGVGPNQLARIIIAGAFGYHLRMASLRRTGIVPASFQGEIEFAGNTCRTGCALLLLDATRREELQAQIQKVSHLAIAEAADFQDRFVNNLSLDA